jgi:hypothetical protein
MAFSTANPSTVVAAMAATSEGVVDGALTSNPYRGLYTSTNAGQTWSYDALASSASEATSATSVVYNAAAGLFFAAVRYQGFYSSPDGLNWTYLANQPGGGILNSTACPQNYLTTCPIYRGEIAVAPGRNEMYVWFVSNSNGQPADQGIWMTTNAGASWTQIDDSGIANCGDFDECGVQQGFFNLELLAVPDCPGGTQTCTNNPTDLYAGAINIYKCTIDSTTSGSPACSALTVTQDFSMGAITPSSETITAGQAANYSFSVSPVGSSFTNPITLSCSNLPSGAQCNFSPNPVTPGTSSASVALTITTISTSAAGTYSVLITGGHRVRSRSPPARR